MEDALIMIMSRSELIIDRISRNVAHLSDL
jgi:hypothetical protein